MTTTTNGNIPEFFKDILSIVDTMHDGIIDVNTANGTIKAVLKNASKPLETFIEAVDGKNWDEITGKMLGTVVDYFVVNQLFAISKAESLFPNTFLAKISEGFSVLGLDKIDLSFSGYFEKAFPAAAKFWEKLSSDEEYANQVLDGLKKVANEKQFTNYYKNTTIEKFLSDFKELLTPLDPKDFISDTANAYKDKQYVDFVGALKYFNEDGSVNFAKYLADTANISLYDPIALDLNGNGKIDTLSLENGVFFDHNGDKVAFKSSWVSSSDGILARDINGDKEINSGAELFGNKSKSNNYYSYTNPNAKDGFESLKEPDSNNDGIISNLDENFDKLQIWQDSNSNGVSETNELKSLSELGIESLNLNKFTNLNLLVA